MTDTITIDPAFVEHLQNAWIVEKKLTELLPTLVEKATHLGLKKNLALHLAETRQHQVAIEAVSKQIGLELEDKEYPDFDKVLEQGQQSINNAQGEDVNVAIIDACISVEQFEMELYHNLGTVADHTLFDGAAKRLWLTFEEERQAHTKLNFLRKSA